MLEVGQIEEERQVEEHEIRQKYEIGKEYKVEEKYEVWQEHEVQEEHEIQEGQHEVGQEHEVVAFGEALDEGRQEEDPRLEAQRQKVEAQGQEGWWQEAPTKFHCGRQLKVEAWLVHLGQVLEVGQVEVDVEEECQHQLKEVEGQVDVEEGQPGGHGHAQIERARQCCGHLAEWTAGDAGGAEELRPTRWRLPSSSTATRFRSKVLRAPHQDTLKSSQ